MIKYKIIHTKKKTHIESLIQFHFKLYVNVYTSNLLPIHSTAKAQVWNAITQYSLSFVREVNKHP